MFCRSSKTHLVVTKGGMESCVRPNLEEEQTLLSPSHLWWIKVLSIDSSRRGIFELLIILIYSFNETTILQGDIIWFKIQCELKQHNH